MGCWLVDRTCPIDFEHWTEDTPQRHSRVYFIRSGVFQLRLNGVESYADNTSVVVIRPGDDLAVAHQLGCGALLTVLESETEWDLRSGQYRMPDALDLRNRRAVSFAHRGVDEFERGERIAALLEDLPASTPRESRWSPRTVLAHRKLAWGATEALIESGYEAGLDGIAAQLNCSP